MLKKILHLLLLLCCFNVFANKAEDEFNVDGIKFKCNCNKNASNSKWKIQHISSNWTVILKTHPPKSIKKVLKLQYVFTS
ncbi:MAG: hypothetical protein LBE97_00465 [Holosporales bacterium]|nr:hypothetical protein [Holosporales bacterium]